MQYVADPGDFRNLAKNIQITFKFHCLSPGCMQRNSISYTLYIFYRSCDFDISISFSVSGRGGAPPGLGKLL